MVKTILLVAGVFLAAPVVALAGAAEERTGEATGQEQAAVPSGSYREAPMLTELVARGELPPVDDRLPAEPALLEPIESVGQYGDTLFVQATDNSPWGDLQEETERGSYLGRFRFDRLEVEGNLAKGFEQAEDDKSITIFLRPGAKWSDGAPFTADDILFMYEDMHWHDEVETWMWLPQARRVVKIDDYTVRLETDEPYPVLTLKMAEPAGGDWHSYYPKHYLQKWHIRYNPDANALAKEEGFDSWDEAFRHHFWWNPRQDMNFPTMQPWVITQSNTTNKVHERNPYYWKVDSQGQQLPYVDRLITNEIPPDQPEIRLLKVINGEVDLGLRPWFGNVDDIPVVIENAEKAGYTVYRYSVGTVASGGLVIPKFEHPDPKVSALMFDRNFRQALSHAINRERILQVIFKGFGKPRQFSLPGIGPQFQTPEGEAFIEEWGQSYIEYDPELAKRLLDEAGIRDRDGDGWREYPDGSELDILVDAAITTATTAELVEQDWEAVGLKISLNVVAGELWAQRALNAEAMISLRGGGASSGMVVANAHWVPTQYASWALAPQVGLWYATGGEQGFDPRGTFLEELYELYAKAISTVDEDERNRLGLEAARLHVTEGPIQISMIDSIPAAAIARKDVRNIQEFALVGSWHLNYPGIISPEQFYIEQ